MVTLEVCKGAKEVCNTINNHWPCYWLEKIPFELVIKAMSRNIMSSCLKKNIITDFQFPYISREIQACTEKHEATK